MGYLISDRYKEWETECDDRFRQLKANEGKSLPLRNGLGIGMDHGSSSIVNRAIVSGWEIVRRMNCGKCPSA